MTMKNATDFHNRHGLVAALCIALTALLLPNTAWAKLNAQVDRSRVAMGDSLVLTIRSSDGDDIENINLSELERLFIVANSSVKREFRISNGRSETTIERELTLFPRRQGTLVIPPLGKPGASSQPIAIIVEAARSATGGNADLFVEAELDRKTGYVQAQLLYTFRLYRAVQLEGNPQLTPLELADATIETLETKSFRTQLNGRPFNVDELRYAVFPHKSGQLNIPSLTLTARLRDSRQSRGLWIGGTGKLVRRNTPALSAQILPVPPQWPDAPWLPLQNIKLEQNWSKPVDGLTLGDSVTRTITMTAIGMPGAQLPQVEQQAPTGIRLYPDQPRSDNVTGENGITGLGISSAALLITEPGHYRLPPIKVPWWDMNAGAVRYAELPAANMHIEAPLLDASNSAVNSGLGLSGGLSGVGGAPPASLSGNPWYWSTLVLLLAWLATVYVWLRPDRRIAQSEGAFSEVLQASDERRLFRQTLEACRNNDPGQARESLRGWGAEIIGGSRHPTLRELTSYVGDGDLVAELNKLDQCLYGKTPADWQGAELASALEQWRGSYVQMQKRARASTLPALNH